MVAGLEALEGAVAAVFVDRDLVGDADPLGAFVALEVLKTSWSIEAESSTITTTSVWGLK